MSWMRGVTGTSVRNPVFANGLMICIVAGGYYATRSMVSETFPEFSLDRISIEVAYPGASPEEVEHGVCTPVERALEGLPGVKKTWSQAGENGAIVVVELLEDVADPRAMVLDIKDRVDQITTFPPEAERPVVHEALVRMQVINLAVYGSVPEHTLKEVATEIREDLLAREEISQIQVSGLRDSEISIQMSREALLEYGLSLSQVTEIVARNCLDLPAGTLRTSNEELTIRTTGQRYTAREFEDLVLIARPDGAIIRLGQVAKVADGFSEDHRSGRFDGQPAAMLRILKTADEDSTTIARTVREYVEAKRAELPEQIRIETWADSSREIDARIHMLLVNGVQGMILVVIVLTLFMDARMSFWVAMGESISYAGALAVLYFRGDTINMMSLFGMIMVSGMLVDDAIVIADSFRQRVLAGDTPALAAMEGPASIALPVIASSATTMISFAPLLFVVGILGKLIEVLPVVIIAALAFSAIEAFCILPSHLRHCLEPTTSSGRIARWRIAARARTERWMERMVGGIYRPILSRALSARVLTVSLAVAVSIVTWGVFAGGRMPFMLLQEVDGNMLMARVRFPQGVPIERTLAAAERLEQAALRLNDPAVFANPGQGDLVTRRFSAIGEYSGWLNESGSHLCEVLIQLQPAEDRRVDGEAILVAWAAQVGVIDDALSLSFERAQDGPTEKPLEIRLLGNDMGQLEAASEEVKTRLAAYGGVSGAEHDMLPGRREVRIRLKPLARTLGVTLDELARQLRSGFHGGEAVRVVRDREEVRVQVRFPDDERRSLADIDSVRILSADGKEIPFPELADYEIGRGYVAIRHQNGERRARVTADVDERVANAEQILAAFEAESLRDLPRRYPGISYRLEGQHAQIIESFDSLMIGFLLSLIANYALLAGMFASYLQPLTILITIPLGFVGTVAGHAIMGYDLTIMSVFGLVGMAGVVVNNAVVLIDAINMRVRAGRPVFEAVAEACELRFRAVILTSVTTVAGLAPLMTERSTQAQSLIPMAISLTFGLAGATLLTLIVVPALYLLMNDGRRLARWLRWGGEYPTAEAVESVT